MPDDLDTAAIAAALGIIPEDIGFGDFAPSLWSAGNPFAMVPGKIVDASRRCGASETHWEAAFSHNTNNPAFVFCRHPSVPYGLVSALTHTTSPLLPCC